MCLIRISKRGNRENEGKEGLALIIPKHFPGLMKDLNPTDTKAQYLPRRIRLGDKDLKKQVETNTVNKKPQLDFCVATIYF